MKELGGRLVVFTGDFNYTVRRNIVDLETRLTGLSWLVLVHSPVKTPAKLLKSQRLNFRKHGWRWVPYQLRDLLARLVPQRTIAAATGVPGSEYELEALRTLSNVRICKVADIHAESSLTLVREFKPDLGLSLAAPILRSELFTLPRQGTINLHKGKVPNFRGMPPAFWELWTEQDEIGCSIHKVTEKLDEGVLLAETSVPRERYSTLRGLQLRLDEIGSELVCHVVEAMLAGNEPSLLQPKGEGKTWRKPTLAQQSKLKKRLARLDPPTNSQWSRGLKDVYVRLAFAWHHFAGWRLSVFSPFRGR